ncbi:sugar transporter domain-containing protein [Ditylenchus destructor]|uniref:Sugar transporter domain-containing protein n=1 Tax=Ditylenchus destructor TaxID=166010 RepID=A0AAD4MRH5_9BILA|nr:sugar transporter domain-containing protein [Ditylenchus destructor]
MQGLKDLDEVIDIASGGGYGYYQLLFLLTSQYACWSQVANTVAGFFSLGGLIPTYICFDKGFEFRLLPSDIQRNSTASCAMVRQCKNLTTESHWLSMYEEYNWICQPDYIRATVSSLLPIGQFIGYAVSGHLSDYFGRKWVCVLGYGHSLAFGFAAAFSPNWTVYLPLVISDSLITPIFVGASLSLALESVHSRHRLIQGYAFQYTLGYMFAGISAYFTNYWRTHLIVMNGIGVPALLLMIIFFEESPRFLIQRGKHKQSTIVLNNITRFNRKTARRFNEDEIKNIWLATDTDEKLKIGRNRRKKHSFVDLFANKYLAAYAMTQIVTGLTMNLVNTTMLYNIQDLSGNPFINISLMGLLRIWTPFVAVALEKGYTNFGRKKLLVGSQVIVFISFCSMFLVDVFQMNDTARAIGTGAVLAGFITQTGFVYVAYKLYTAELFPTVIRTIALGTFSCTSLLGTVVGPQLIYLKKFWHPAPYFGASMCILTALILAVLLLPETKSSVLTDTIEEARNERKLSCE